jgi:hypothetical protein
MKNLWIIFARTAERNDAVFVSEVPPHPRILCVSRRHRKIVRLSQKYVGDHSGPGIRNQLYPPYTRPPPQVHNGTLELWRESCCLRLESLLCGVPSTSSFSDVLQLSNPPFHGRPDK